MKYEKNKYFVKNGKVFAIGDTVVCVDAGDFDGLHGVVVDIRTDKDCLFPEHDYEIIVDFLNPQNPNIQRRLVTSPVSEGLGCIELVDEYDFSSVLKGVVFYNVDELEIHDVNIKALKPYACAVEVEPLKAYVVEIKNDFGKDNTVQGSAVCYTSVQDAEDAFARAVALVQEEYKEWLKGDDINITVAEDRFFASTCKNFLQVATTVVDVSVNPTQQRLLSEEYNFSHRIEDVRGKVYEKWSEDGGLSDDDYCRLYDMAPELAARVDDLYDDNSVRADCFWATVEQVIDEEVE